MQASDVTPGPIAVNGCETRKDFRVLCRILRRMRDLSARPQTVVHCHMC